MREKPVSTFSYRVLAVESYLEGLDAHLADVLDANERIGLLEGERRRVDRLEQALSDWAACDRHVRPQPTRFSAFDLALCTAR